MGYTRLQSETVQLQQNPLLHEVTRNDCLVASPVTVSSAQHAMLERIRQSQNDYQRQMETAS